MCVAVMTEVLCVVERYVGCHSYYDGAISALIPLYNLPVGAKTGYSHHVGVYVTYAPYHLT